MFFQLACFDMIFFPVEILKLTERQFKSTQMIILSKEKVSVDKFHPFKA